jgi:hypothetical protein
MPAGIETSGPTTVETVEAVGGRPPITSVAPEMATLMNNHERSAARRRLAARRYGVRGIVGEYIETYR